jgi:hypothetical protein
MFSGEIQNENRLTISAPLSHGNVVAKKNMLVNWKFLSLE